MIRTHRIYAAALLAGLCTGIAHADDAQQTYQKLFGADETKALQSPGGTDDVSLAQVLLKAGRETDADIETRAFYAAKAYDLAARFPEGTATAVEAGKLQIELKPEQAEAAHVKIIAVLQKAYTIARGTAKNDAGDALVDAMVAAAEAQVASHDLIGAIEIYRRAQPIAAATHSMKQDVIRTGLEDCRSQAVVQKQMESLKAQIKAKPDDHAAGNSLLLLCITELDDPATAMLYTFVADDATLISSVKLAAVDATQLEPAQMLTLGDWYRGLSEKTSVGSRIKMLQRAQGYYNAFLTSTSPDKDAAQKPRVEFAIKNIDDLIAKLGTSQPRAVESFAQFSKRLKVHSAGLDHGNDVRIAVESKVIVEGKGFDRDKNKANRRGLNVVAWHKGKIVLSEVFDTYASKDASERFAKAIGDLPRDAYVVIAACDEPMQNFTDAAQTALGQIGAKTGLSGQPAHTAYILIGVKGMAEGKAIEVIGPTSVDYPVVEKPAEADANKPANSAGNNGNVNGGGGRGFGGGGGGGNNNGGGGNNGGGNTPKPAPGGGRPPGGGGGGGGGGGHRPK